MRPATLNEIGKELVQAARRLDPKDRKTFFEVIEELKKPVGGLQKRKRASDKESQS